MSGLSAPLSSVVGGKTAKALEKALGLRTVDDLLRHYPRRYAERGTLTDLAMLEEGESVTVLAEIEQVTSRPMQQRRGSILEAVVTDGKGRLSLTFFNQKWREHELRPGRRGLFAGQISSFRGKRQLAHPQCLLLPDGVDDDPAAIEEFAGALIPVYPATAAVTSWHLAGSIRVALDTLADVEDPLSDDVRTAEGIIGLEQALRQVHRPTDAQSWREAQARLRFEEAFVLQVVLAQRRAQMALLPATARITGSGPLQAAFDRQLPFELTGGQVEVGAEIAADLAGTHPMHRLVQGDVGSGKTIVALRAMLGVVDAGGQAAMLAPTEVLAVQHHRSMTAMLGPLAQRGMLGGDVDGTKVALLTGSQRTATRRRQLLDVISGDAGIVIGTHALIQDAVEFRDLGLVVIDEQHRFGVEQRAALAAKARGGTRPHVLVMTATPIPRTIAMTVFGDLDISTLTELPAGRSPIATHVVAVLEQPGHVERAWERVREAAAAGHRIYVVCPRIGDTGGPDAAEGDEGDDTGDGPAVASVIAVAERLASTDLSGLRVEVLHGRMTAEAKDDCLRRFTDVDAADGIDVLVSTTVIEVGVDVPAATIMIIIDADRFGISQLHQLRGRVGRGAFPSLCLLFTEMPKGSPARERLEAVASTTDGFELSRKDLEFRREGDVLGSMQSGRRSSLRLLEVVRDEAVIERARAAAMAVVEQDPSLVSQPALLSAIAALVHDDQADFMEKA
ncbi:MAG: ATP-dependent DNA helicase RecG [Actinobacteria bacterium]|uniref:Probable DNA 3'-5' helicase RecG n=1 Tax=freshwater metagenome TaxID=449393 RepID=A0A6J7D9V2_9ZZZZ|nr:ATP-dependent DNA helicase RecG [Actinomycetota bacterium]